MKPNIIYVNPTPTLNPLHTQNLNTPHTSTITGISQTTQNLMSNPSTTPLPCPSSPSHHHLSTFSTEQIFATLRKSLNITDEKSQNPSAVALLAQSSIQSNFPVVPPLHSQLYNTSTTQCYPSITIINHFTRPLVNAIEIGSPPSTVPIPISLTNLIPTQEITHIPPNSFHFASPHPTPDPIAYHASPTALLPGSDQLLSETEQVDSTSLNTIPGPIIRKKPWKCLAREKGNIALSSIPKQSVTGRKRLSIIEEDDVDDIDYKQKRSKISDGVISTLLFSQTAEAAGVQPRRQQ